MSNLNLHASQRFIELLTNIDHQISRSLLRSISEKERHRVSYLDFGNSNDNISYIINNKFEEILNNNPTNWKELVWVDKRTNLKIGKFIKMLYGDYFPVNHPKEIPMPKIPNDIESFVNKYKFERDKNINYNRFEIVSGEMIRHWYSQENYSRYTNSETSLGKSCMRYAESGKFLNMYVNNPEIFSMLILKDDRDKLKGRALIWNLSKPDGRVYMDRIYCVNDHDIESFKNYAKEQGWLYRFQQCFGWFNKIVDPITDQIIEQRDLLLEVQLNKLPKIHYDYYPYLDTLSIYNTKSGILSNNGENRRKSGHILLTDYQGNYHSEVDERPRVYSNIYGEDILEEDAVYVEIGDSYVYSNDSVYVKNSGGRYAYKNSSLIVRCNIPGKDTCYFLKEDTVWSEYLNTHIFKDSVRTAYLDKEKTKSVLIHFKMIGMDFVKRDGEIFFEKKIIDDSVKKSMWLDLKRMDKIELVKKYGSYDRDYIFKYLLKKMINNGVDNEDETSTEEQSNKTNSPFFSGFGSGYDSILSGISGGLSGISARPQSTRNTRTTRSSRVSPRPEPSGLSDVYNMRFTPVEPLSEEVRPSYVDTNEIVSPQTINRVNDRWTSMYRQYNDYIVTYDNTTQSDTISTDDISSSDSGTY